MTGRVGKADQALAVPATPANAVDGPSGFDPSRMTERVAWALFQLEWAHNGSEEEFASSRAYWMEGAVEAVKAMRDPTEAMLAASEREWDGRMRFRSSGAWQAMVDAALAERGGA